MAAFDAFQVVDEEQCRRELGNQFIKWEAGVVTFDVGNEWMRAWVGDYVIRGAASWDVWPKDEFERRFVELDDDIFRPKTAIVANEAHEDSI